MLRIATGCVGVDRGSIQLFSDFEDGGAMWAGQGARRAARDVRFDQPFVAPPAVQVGLSMWDLDSRTNARADLRAEDVTDRGFTLVFRTWGDSRIARVRADWLAIGALRDPEEWQVD